MLAHGRAGGAAERQGADHMIAGDVIEALPAGLAPRPVAARPCPATVGEMMDAGPGERRRRDAALRIWCASSASGLPGVPVVDEGGHVIGIITEADLVLPDEDGDDLHLPHYIEHHRRHDLRSSRWGTSRSACGRPWRRAPRDLITAARLTVDADDSIRKAARLIRESGHNRLPVEEYGHLVGIVTRADVCGALATAE